MLEVFSEIYNKGGPVIYVIMAASIVGLGYIFYCLLVLRRAVVLADPLVKIAGDLRADSDCKAAEDLCRREGGPFAEILLAVLTTRNSGRDEAEAMVESAGRRAAHDLSHGILALEIVAAISPLLGLLGTVLGMHRAFYNIQQAGVKNFSMLSGAISEALITTICGLVVAIPAYVAFTWFSRKVDDLVLDMERHAMAMMARLRPAREESAPDGPDSGRQE